MKASEQNRWLAASRLSLVAPEEMPLRALLLVAAVHPRFPEARALG